jgi:hypothetical protein
MCVGDLFERIAHQVDHTELGEDKAFRWSQVRMSSPPTQTLKMSLPSSILKRSRRRRARIWPLHSDPTTSRAALFVLPCQHPEPGTGPDEGCADPHGLSCGIQST